MTNKKMMMNVRLNNISIRCMLAISLSALFASCKDETEEDAESYKAKVDKGAICFSTYTSGATRAADVNENVLKGLVDGRKGGFYVSAWYDNKPFFKDSCFFENGLAVDNSNIITNAFDTKSDTYYWPYEVNSSKTVAFRAFNNLKKVQDGNPIWIGDNKDKIKYSPYWFAKDQEDLVVAYSEVEKKPENGVQPLNFIHALSKINFSFTGADAEYKYTINRVEVIAAGTGEPTMSFITTTDNAIPSTQAEKIKWKFTAIDGAAALVVADKSTPANGGTAKQGVLYTYHKEDSDPSGVNKNIGLVVNGTETKDMDDNLMLLPQNGMIAIRVYYKVEDGEGNLIGNCGYYRTNTKGNHDVKMKDGKVDNGNDADNYFYHDKDDKDNGVWGCKTLIVDLGSAITDGWQAGKSYRFVITLPTDNFLGDTSGDGVADESDEGQTEDYDGDGDKDKSEFGMDEGYIEFSVSVKAWIDENYNAAFLSNRVKGDTDTSHIEMYNGNFLDNDFEYSDEYLNYLTEKYVEAYSLDIQKDSDINKMLEWVNSKIKNISASKGDLSIDDDSAMFLWSTLQFDGKWCFNKDETKKDKFNPLNGSPYDVYFMNNTYYGKAYDYGDYWSFTVSMTGGFSMQFITATKSTDNVFSIIKDSKRNFLIESKNHYKPENKGANQDYLIEISIPRFETKCEMSIKDPFVKMGLGHLYNEEKDPNNNVMCGVTKTVTDYFYLSDTKTKSYIHWDEDGVTATSYTFTGAAAGAAAPTSSGVQFILDSPFIYCIRDRNNLPLFLGRVDRP